MRGKLATVILLLFLPVVANAIAIDGSFWDWGITNPNTGLAPGDSFNTAITGITAGGIQFWEESGHRSDGFVSPGYGGALFDIKGLYFTSDATNYYFAAVVGLAPG